MTPATRDKLLQVGAKPLVAALARHGLKGRDVAPLPTVDPFAGAACLVLEACRAGHVLVLDRPVARLPDHVQRRLVQRLAGIVMRRDLRDVPVAAGDVILRDRTALVVLPAALADQIAEEAAEAIALEEFTAEQVNQGGGVYGLHIPSGERAKQAFAQWRRMKGR
jgi:regulator of RNase E activity RraA